MKETGAALIFIATVIVATISCGDQPYIYGHPEEIPPGEECPSGGYWLSQGIDENGNDKLDEAEVQDKLKVCNGVFWDVDSSGKSDMEMTGDDWFKRYDVVVRTPMTWDTCEPKAVRRDYSFDNQQPFYQIAEYCKYPTIATCNDNDVLVNSECWCNFFNNELHEIRGSSYGAASWYTMIDGSDGWYCDVRDDLVELHVSKNINIGEWWDGTWRVDHSIPPSEEYSDKSYYDLLNDGELYIESHVTCINIP